MRLNGEVCEKAERRWAGEEVAWAFRLSGVRGTDAVLWRGDALRCALPWLGSGSVEIADTSRHRACALRYALPWLGFGSVEIADTSRH